MNNFDGKLGDETTEPTVDFDIVSGGNGEPGANSSVMLNIPGRGIILPETGTPGSIVVKIPGATRECVSAMLSGKSVKPEVEVMNFGQLNPDGRKRIFKADLDIVGDNGRWSAKDFAAFGSNDHPADAVKKVIAKIVDAVGSKPMNSAFDVTIEIKI
jgi:hypothetical protein